MTSIPLLDFPKLSSNYISRPHLIEKLNLGLNRKLTTIVAPAGYGKTALLSEWVSHLDIPVVWLNTKKSYNDLERAYSRFEEAMVAVFPEFDVTLPNSLASIWKAENYESVFMDAIFKLDREFVVVLDDYHLMAQPTFIRVMNHLLDVMPPFMHWVIVSRRDIPFYVSRLRVEGELLELNMADLRFSDEESNKFFESRNLSLSDSNLEYLYENIKGWIGLMQLAALTIEACPYEDKDRYVRKITAHSTYFQDYMSEEIFSTQDELTQEFLLKTSVLRKINLSLASHIMDGRDISIVYDALLRAGLLMSEDDNEEITQYHYLFAQYLRNRFFKLEGMEEMCRLHQQASLWYEEKGLFADAVNHAYASLDLELATRLLNANTQETNLIEYLSWQYWLLELPDSVLLDYPDACLNCATSLYLINDFDPMERPLRIAEQIWKVQGQNAKLAEVHILHSLKALYRREYEKVVEHGTYAAENATNAVSKGAAHHVLGAGLYYAGNLILAEEYVRSGRKYLWEIDDTYSAQIATSLLARICARRGKLQEAEGIHLEVSEYSDPKVYEQMIAAHIFLGRLYYQWNKLDLAETHLLYALQQSQTQYTGRHWSEAHSIYAKVLFAFGRIRDGWTQLCQAESLAERLNDQKQIRLSRSMRARLELRQGNFMRAISWEDEAPSLNLKCDYEYALIPEYLTMVRLMIARLKRQGDKGLYSQIEAILDCIEVEAKKNDRTPEVIECRVLLAIAQSVYGDVPSGVRNLTQALRLAQPQGYIRVFLDEGEDLLYLLKQVNEEDISSEYISALFRAFDENYNISLKTEDVSSFSILTDRELDVLKLIARGYTAKEVAEELVISWHTARTHTKNIYAKLEVCNRLQAVERAQRLKLI